MPESAEPCAEGPKIKICGVTTVEDALASARCGADLIGLNFYRPSPRFVELEAARQIVDALRQEAPSVSLVGVFVNAPEVEVERIDQTLGLDVLQFHGDESPSTVKSYAARGKRCIRALRLEAGDLRREEILAPWKDGWAVLLDAPHETLYGGSGQPWNFGLAARLAEQHRLLLAGGLDSENVGSAVRAAPAVWGLDVCSGVERSPGRKCPDRLSRFFAAVRSQPVDTSPAIG